MPQPATEAIERALNALARKERTRAELEEWLGARGFEPEEICGAIERLAEAGEIDDARFARRYAEDKRELRGWGPERIREALAARGVPAELVADVLDADSPATQLERAVALLAKRGEQPVDEPSRARALAYLARRGYDSDVAYAAIREHGRASRAGLRSIIGISTIKGADASRSKDAKGQLKQP